MVSTSDKKAAVFCIKIFHQDFDFLKIHEDFEEIYGATPQCLVQAACLITRPWGKVISTSWMRGKIIVSL